MKAVYTDSVDVNKGIVTIVSSTTPASLNITGADVEGLPDDFILAAGSVIITPTTNYVAFGEGEFTEKSNGGGSGGGGGGSVMIVHCDPETNTLDKTFIEIYNAMTSGTPVYISIIWDAEGYNCTLVSITDASYDDEYSLYKVDENKGNTYIAETVNDYPQYWE